VLLLLTGIFMHSSMSLATVNVSEPLPSSFWKRFPTDADVLLSPEEEWEFAKSSKVSANERTRTLLNRCRTCNGL
jgi:hypothetical protein